MTRTHSRDRTPPWIHAEHIAGFLLGLALAAMAIDYGMSKPTSSLPLTPVRTTGP